MPEVPLVDIDPNVDKPEEGRFLDEDVLTRVPPQRQREEQASERVEMADEGIGEASYLAPWKEALRPDVERWVLNKFRGEEVDINNFEVSQVADLVLGLVLWTWLP